MANEIKKEGKKRLSFDERNSSATAAILRQLEGKKRLIIANQSLTHAACDIIGKADQASQYLSAGLATKYGEEGFALLLKYKNRLADFYETVEEMCKVTGIRITPPRVIEDVIMERRGTKAVGDTKGSKQEKKVEKKMTAAYSDGNGQVPSDSK